MLFRKISRDSSKFSTGILRGYCATAASKTVPSNGFDGLQMPLTLLGPPELYRLPTTTTTTPAIENNLKVSADAVVTATSANKSSTNDKTNPFMDSMLSNYNRGSTAPQMGLTENSSPTYLSSGNPCLDFFFHVVPSTPADHVCNRLKLAWDQDPSTALKLVYNLRGVRGTGKSDREGFYASALWLHKTHPNTLAGNVGSVAEFGYFKDLLQILYRLIMGHNVREEEKKLIVKNKSTGKTFFLEKKKNSHKSHEEKRLAVAEKGLGRYNNDPTYRYLHDCVSQLFADRLQSDLEKVRSGKYDDLSLAAKWCPSLYSRFDNSTLICESIARRLFPRDQYPEYEGLEDAHYAYRVRDRLRKEVLVPLRKALKLPEVYMTARQWSSIVYTRVASIAMRNYAELFQKHDKERFSKYLESVAKGKVKIAAGALLPHQIVKRVMFHIHNSPVSRVVAELQWKRIVEDLSEIGELKNCLAICDVSGSMGGLPLDVSIGLGLLVSELSEEPWKGKLITFSMKPELQVIQGEDLQSKMKCISRMYWDCNTDFQRVFDRILEVAVEAKLTEEQMIKRLFVFSDMEFDEASANDWETDYEAIVRKFNEKGFSRVPEIVFWNLRDSGSTPVLSSQKGVALVSGFSKNFLKLFLDQGGVLDTENPTEGEVSLDPKNPMEGEVSLDPENTMEADASDPVVTKQDNALDPVKTMEAAISGEEYQKLVVLD